MPAPVVPASTPAPTSSGASADDEGAAAAANLAAEHRAEGNDAPSTDPTVRPEWCPEKFARFNEDKTFNASLSATELSKAHGGLEARFTQGQQGDDGTVVDKDGNPVVNDDDNVDNADDLPAASDEPLTDKSFWDSLTAEYNDTGGLSTESRTIVRDLGIPDQMVEDFIAGQAARGEQYHASVTSVLGDNGAEEYDKLVDWAGDKMDADQAKVFNDAVTSGDRHRAQVAIRDLKTQYVAAEGSFDNLQVGGGAGGGNEGVQPFANRAEQSKAINDSRYGTDKAYTLSVQGRVDISPAF